MDLSLLISDNIYYSSPEEPDSDEYNLSKYNSDEYVPDEYEPDTYEYYRYKYYGLCLLGFFCGFMIRYWFE